MYKSMLPCGTILPFVLEKQLGDLYKDYHVLC